MFCKQCGFHSTEIYLVGGTYMGEHKSIKENIKNSAKESLGLHELKQHKPWFDEEC